MGLLQADLRRLAANAATVKVATIKPPPAPKKGGNMPVAYRDVPRLRLSSRDVPAVAGWEVGQEYTVLLRVKQTGKEENEYTNGTEATFEIKQVACLNQKQKAGGEYGRAPAKS